MELHPFLEKDTAPVPGLWYVLAANGEPPNFRVGHTCTFVKEESSKHGKLYVIGGANPDGPFSDTYVLDLKTFAWDTIEAAGFKPRYEHCAFQPQCKPDCIYVFGGAHQAGNYNDVQCLSLSAKTWTTVEASGTAPSPRTHHTTAACGDKLYVYSGGQSGADPVGDRQMHCFQADTHSWGVMTLRGETPKPRHGHVMVAVDNKIYIHGGMARTTFYQDLHVVDLEKRSVSEVKLKRGIPSARAAHCAIPGNNCFYIFGGMNKDGALDDTWKFDTTTNRWKLIQPDVPPPSCRLDFGSALLAVCNPQLLTPRDQLSCSHKMAEDTLLKIQTMNMEDEGAKTETDDAESDTSHGTLTPIPDSYPEPDKPSTPEPLPQVEALDIPAPHDNPESSACARAEGGDTGSAESYPSATSAANGDMATEFPMLLVMGGTDTQGEWFDDCMVLLAP